MKSLLSLARAWRDAPAAGKRVARWNFTTELTQAIAGRPSGCQCGECERGEVFRCDVCGRDMPWCFACDDDLPGACDDCWSAAHREDTVTKKTPVVELTTEQMEALKNSLWWVPANEPMFSHMGFATRAQAERHAESIGVPFEKIRGPEL